MIGLGDNSSLHRDIWSLIPWYVNSRISDRDRKRVDSHLETCTACRRELQQQQSIFQAMASDGSIEHIPAASLRRLKQRLAMQGTDASAGRAAEFPAARRRPLPWQGLIAASLAVVAVAIGAIAYSLRPQGLPHASPGAYYTVTANAPRPENATIRAVFSADLTVSQLQNLLDESRLTIVAGPSEAGVYSLAPSSKQSVNASLNVLRRHASVRFAESTGFVPPTSTTQ